MLCRIESLRFSVSRSITYSRPSRLSTRPAISAAPGWTTPWPTASSRLRGVMVTGTGPVFAKAPERMTFWLAKRSTLTSTCGSATTLVSWEAIIARNSSMVLPAASTLPA
ncbi:hypothetical protein D9M70_534130 [compost metagenome]